MHKINVFRYLRNFTWFYKNTACRNEIFLKNILILSDFIMNTSKSNYKNINEYIKECKNGYRAFN